MCDETVPEMCDETALRQRDTILCVCARRLKVPKKIPKQKKK